MKSKLLKPVAVAALALTGAVLPASADYRWGFCMWTMNIYDHVCVQVHGQMDGGVECWACYDNSGFYSLGWNWCAGDLTADYGSCYEC
jgi:hypothetical protein